MENVTIEQSGTTQNDNKEFDYFFQMIPGIEKAGTVPVVRASDLTEKSFINDWVSKNKACLVKGAVSHWPAVAKWKDKAYWLTHCDNFEVNIIPHQNFIDPARQNENQIRMKYHDAIERLFSNQDRVFSIPSEQITTNNRFSGISPDVKTFTFMPQPPPPRWYQQMRFFTYRRAATAWHFHNVDETLMCQVNGTKKVALLSPHIPRTAEVTNFFLKESYIRGEKLDPALDLKPMIVYVEEGDALYIPPYWHHVVVPVDGQIGFTLAYCWKSPLHILGNFSNYFVRALFKQAMFPVGLKTFILPVLGFSAMLAYGWKKITGKV
jgi:hypothetical protein